MLSPLKKPFAARPHLSPCCRRAIRIRFVKHTLKIKYIKRRQISNNITSKLPGGTSQTQYYQFGRNILLDLAKDSQRKIENTNHDFLEDPSSKWFHSPQHKSQEAGDLLLPWQR